MNRRIFLARTLGLTLTSLAAGCQRLSRGDLGLAMLAGSVPGQAVQAFQRSQPAPSGQVSVVAKDSLLELYRLLQDWQTQVAASPTAPKAAPKVAQWVTQADTWLAPAIQQGLIQPISLETLDRWPQIPGAWPALVRRNAQGFADETGETWALPYRWTPLAILYDHRTLGSEADPMQRWADLLRPAWQQRLMLPDDERIVIGLALKAFNASANTPDLAAVLDLEDFLTQLHRQVRGYNATHSLKALIMGDATAVVGWLDDLLPVAQRYRHLSLMVPAEGTLASADLWVRPRGAPPLDDLATAWLNFCLSATFVEQLGIFGPGLSPWHWGAAPADLPPAFQPAAGLLPSTTGLENSEFLLPLPPASQAQYRQLWQRLRTT
ncbi:MAG: extracellular solute-binding protein [Leptolyngbya sp.]|nr:extracellular solute-binding protein [Leptolyngbya sp.]